MEKKLYNDVKLQFKGECLNGKRWNGKGHNKEAKNDLEIKEGKGKGKEYNYFLWISLNFMNIIIFFEKSEILVLFIYIWYIGELDLEGEYLNGE